MKECVIVFGIAAAVVCVTVIACCWVSGAWSREEEKENAEVQSEV